MKFIQPCHNLLYSNKQDKQSKNRILKSFNLLINNIECHINKNKYAYSNITDTQILKKSLKF